MPDLVLARARGPPRHPAGVVADPTDDLHLGTGFSSRDRDPAGEAGGADVARRHARAAGQPSTTITPRRVGGQSSPELPLPPLPPLLPLPAAAARVAAARAVRCRCRVVAAAVVVGLRRLGRPQRLARLERLARLQRLRRPQRPRRLGRIVGRPPSARRRSHGRRLSRCEPDGRRRRRRASATARRAGRRPRGTVRWTAWRSTATAMSSARRLVPASRSGRIAAQEVGRPDHRQTSTPSRRRPPRRSPARAPALEPPAGARSRSAPASHRRPPPGVPPGVRGAPPRRPRRPVPAAARARPRPSRGPRSPCSAAPRSAPPTRPAVPSSSPPRSPSPTARSPVSDDLVPAERLGLLADPSLIAGPPRAPGAAAAARAAAGSSPSPGVGRPRPRSRPARAPRRTGARRSRDRARRAGRPPIGPRQRRRRERQPPPDRPPIDGRARAAPARPPRPGSPTARAPTNSGSAGSIHATSRRDRCAARRNASRTPIRASHAPNGPSPRHGRERSERHEERLLGDVLGLVRIAEHALAGAHEHVRLPFHQESERLAVAAQHGIDRASRGRIRRSLPRPEAPAPARSSSLRLTDHATRYEARRAEKVSPKRFSEQVRRTVPSGLPSPAVRTAPDPSRPVQRSESPRQLARTCRARIPSASRASSDGTRSATTAHTAERDQHHPGQRRRRADPLRDRRRPGCCRPG